MLVNTETKGSTIAVLGFSESLQHCVRPQHSVTSLYGRFRAQKLPYKEVTEFWGLMQCCRDSAKSCIHELLIDPAGCDLASYPGLLTPVLAPTSRGSESGRPRQHGTMEPYSPTRSSLRVPHYVTMHQIIKLHTIFTAFSSTYTVGHTRTSQ